MMPLACDGRLSGHSTSLLQVADAVRRREMPRGWRRTHDGCTSIVSMGGGHGMMASPRWFGLDASLRSIPMQRMARLDAHLGRKPRAGPCFDFVAAVIRSPSPCLSRPIRLLLSLSRAFGVASRPALLN